MAGQKDRMTRKRKQADNVDPRHSYGGDMYGINEWVLNDEQQELRKLLYEKDIVFVDSKAGVGKSSSILYTYIEQYLKDKYKQIVIIRQPVEVGPDKIGSLPNGLDEKLEPHFIAYRDILEELLNKGKVECDLNKRIHFMPSNYAIGRSLHDSLILITEAQQMPPMILKMLLERIGRNSTCCVEGDSTQMYTTDGRRNGLAAAVKVFFDELGCVRKDVWEDNLAFYRFSNKYNMRSEIVQIVNDAYEEYSDGKGEHSPC
jgi:predicted ribonuclease YlaK